MVEILGGLLLATAVSGIVPLVNAELLVVGAAAALPAAAFPLVAAVSTVGQMLTKTLLFGLARWAPTKLPQRAGARLKGASVALEKKGGAAAPLVFTSALVGLPPFYGVSIACGALGMKLPVFLVSGTAGRAVRFGVLAWAASVWGKEALDVLANSGLPAFLVGGGG